jgi:hypothetical protein
LSRSPEMTNPTLSAIGGMRSRRSWSDEEKQRIVAEAALPGASVADTAGRHGVGANLVFNWRKTARAALSAAEPNGLAVRLPANAFSPVAEHCEFMPIGVIGRAEDEGPALVAGASSAVSRRRNLGESEPPLGDAGSRACRPRSQPQCGGHRQPERQDHGSRWAEGL